MLMMMLMMIIMKKKKKISCLLLNLFLPFGKNPIKKATSFNVEYAVHHHHHYGDDGDHADATL